MNEININQKIILATTSPRRLEIFKYLGIPFESRKHEFNEESINLPDPESLIIKIAEGKALSIANYFDSNVIIIGVDTMVVSPEGIPLGKPKSKQEAVKMLLGLSGKEHNIITGYCFFGQNKKITGAEITKIKFRIINEQEATSYVDIEKDVLDIAGAYDHEHLGAVLVESISGDFYSSVGMPIFRLAEVLKKDFSVSCLT